MSSPDTARPQLKLRFIHLDTGRENVVVISRHSHALRPEIYRGFSRVELRQDSKVRLATLLVTDDDGLVGADEIGLAQPAFNRFAKSRPAVVSVTPAPSPVSLNAVRDKIQGKILSTAEIGAIVDDLAHYRYSDMEIAAFLISSASFMTSGERWPSSAPWPRPAGRSNGMFPSWSISTVSAAFRAIGRP
jgi:thymidine phosphorylase